MSIALQKLVASINDTLDDLGIRVEEIERPNEVVVAIHFPPNMRLADGNQPFSVIHREPIPSDAVGAMVGAKHKFRKKLVKGVKKIAKSKAFKALSKIALKVAPGGAQLSASMNALKAAKNAAKHLRSKHPAKKTAAAVQVAVAQDQLDSAQSADGGSASASAPTAQDSPDQDVQSSSSDNLWAQDTSALDDAPAADAESPDDDAGPEPDAEEDAEQGEDE